MPDVTILVVDDDPKNQKIVGAYLKALDVFMPYMSGLELSEALKADPRTSGIPILAMSAYHEYAAGEPRRDLAADDFLKKPVRMDQLLEKSEACWAERSNALRVSLLRAPEYPGPTHGGCG